MQVPRLGDAVGGVGERDPGGGGRRGGPARARVPAGRRRRSTASRRTGTAGCNGRAPRRSPTRTTQRAVAEQRIGEREAQRVRVEGVRVEQVQRVVQHRVARPTRPPRPCGPGRRDPARCGWPCAGPAATWSGPRAHAAEGRPARARGRRSEGEGAQRRAPVAAAARGARGLVRGAGHRARRRLRGGARAGPGGQPGCSGGSADRCSRRPVFGAHADRRSIREAPEPLRRIGRRAFIRNAQGRMRKTAAS